MGFFKGGPVAQQLREATMQRVRNLQERGKTPILVTVRVGGNSDDIAYERGIIGAAQKTGVTAKQLLLPQDVSQQKLLDSIDDLNKDPQVDGVLIFRPLPAHIDDEAVCRALDPAKDIDGITPQSMAELFMDRGGCFAPCTARACIDLLDYYGIELTGKRVTVFGRSLVVGKPVAMLAMSRNATVTICHSRTAPGDMEAAGRNADIVIAAIGRAGFIGQDLIGTDQIILDVGINDDGAGGICGDVDPEAAAKAAALTPVPGGIGSVTTAVLMDNVTQAAERKTF